MKKQFYVIVTQVGSHPSTKQTTNKLLKIRSKNLLQKYLASLETSRPQVVYALLVLSVNEFETSC